MNLIHAEQYDLLLGSGLYATLVEQDLLVPHEEADLSLAAAPGAYRVIRPERIPFVSYPYEWCFGQLRDAALATLAIQKVALEYGITLRDASAYNIQFLRGRPVLIDTLSFDAVREGEPWVAYRQFCQHFLAPLALIAYRDARLGQLSRIHLDGVPLDLATALLPRRARLRPGLAMHLAAHAASQARHGEDSAVPAKATRRRFGRRAFRGLIESLESAVRGLAPRDPRSAWSGYYAEGQSYSAEALDRKRALVAEFLRASNPASVWDLGANTGQFSRIATAMGMQTVAFDQDPWCVERSYRQAKEDDEQRLLPLVLDLTNPSPRIGWANEERLSLADRGPAGLVMALALVHHLAIGNNVPFERLAGSLRALGHWLIVEFVPKEDPMVRRLLATREDVFPRYDQAGFEAAFGTAFTIERRESIEGSTRTLYLMRTR